MRILIILFFILIVLSLASALFSLLRGNNSRNMFLSLRLRIILSGSLVFIILASYFMGSIKSKGIIINKNINNSTKP